ncbi:hypothetical protein GDO78_019669 [Eleutherodactylus coqui]|uniref:Uncharacterized protein n=1 Tax=Eleutherodactylus coqui TaxID=57060 RepID=A0A8J6E938_ELECQ|nr:hypothetical protein GDO78_019669 [Eleutherodactylus coqui]
MVLMNDPPWMEKTSNEITKRILNFTLEIIYLLTGEPEDIYPHIQHTDISYIILQYQSSACDSGRQVRDARGVVACGEVRHVLSVSV